MKDIKYYFIQIIKFGASLVIDSFYLPYYRLNCLLLKTKPAIPSGHLIHSVSGTRNFFYYIRIGKKIYEDIAGILKKNNIDIIEETGDILDFGCGCARVSRHFHSYAHARIYGTDYSKKAIHWCNDYFPSSRFSQNDLKPPLGYEDGKFELIYAISVFTHLTEELQNAWIDELHRILNDGGYLILTIHGEAFFNDLNDEEKTLFLNNKIIIRNTEMTGYNTCEAYHSFSSVNDLLGHKFKLVDHIPHTNKDVICQDVYLFQKITALI